MQNASILVLTLACLGGCSSGGGSTNSLSERCATQCNRYNRLCGSSSECTHSCAPTSPVLLHCMPQVDAYFACFESLSDADVCLGVPATCQSQGDTYGTCARSQIDAGSGTDANAGGA